MLFNPADYAGDWSVSFTANTFTGSSQGTICSFNPKRIGMIVLPRSNVGACRIWPLNNMVTGQGIVINTQNKYEIWYHLHGGIVHQEWRGTNFSGNTTIDVIEIIYDPLERR